jgi:hypothetical protein
VTFATGALSGFAEMPAGLRAGLFGKGVEDDADGVGSYVADLTIEVFWLRIEA